MKAIPLTHYGLNASRVVMGCMSLGGEWNKSPITAEHVREAQVAVEAALEIGISMYDHADIYRMGKAEQVFGEVLKGKQGLREQIILQSKCGIRLSDEQMPTRFDFSKEHILRSVDGILQRLSTDYLDILLLHRPDALMELDDIAEAFATLKAAGKVRHFGVSNMNVGQMNFLQNSLPDPLVANQLQIGMGHLYWLDQGIHVNQKAGVGVNFGEGLLEYCQLHKVQIQAWSPLDGGIFTGRDVSGEPENVQKTAALVRRMAYEKGTSAEAIVLGWIMRHPAGIQTVIGTINPSRIKACADAERQAELMTRDEWYTLYVSARGEPMP